MPPYDGSEGEFIAMLGELLQKLLIRVFSVRLHAGERANVMENSA
jgi:hypothetical protein